MDTVSVVIPTYNRGHLLPRALDSIFNQSVLPDEIIVVDDASDDDTTEILSRYNSLNLIRLNENRGAAHARNLGVREASGDWVAFLDSDDEWLPDRLASQLAVASRLECAALICSGIRVTSQSGNTEDYCYDVRIPSGGWRIGHFMHYAFSPSTWLIHRELFLEFQGFDESYPNCEDLDFLARLVGACHIESMPQVLVNKYNNPDSLDADYKKLDQSLSLLLSRHRTLWRESPKAEQQVWSRMAVKHLDNNEFQKARVSYYRAIKCSPMNAKIWFWIALSLLGERTFYAVRKNIAARIAS